MPKQQYNDNSIKALKGPDRVRLRPSVIFGSDGIEGCCHSVFEIISNSIDEAREGYGNKIIVTYYADKSIEIQDFGRGTPVDYNEREKAYNWELLFCELYAGGKYDNQSAMSYEYSLGLNGLGLCATQYSSEYMEAEIFNGEFQYNLSFKKGFPVEKNKEKQLKKLANNQKSGTRLKWRPDLDVFKDINIPKEYFQNILKKQSIINSNLTFIFKYETANGKFEEEKFLYENGVVDYITEIAGNDALTSICSWSAERKGKDRDDLPEYKVKLNVVCCFSNKNQLLEYYHNASYLEHGGSPDKAVKNAFIYSIDSYLKQNNKYIKNESKITYQDIFDCLILVSNSFSSITSYENQTKKAINNKFIQEAMTEFLRHQLEVYFIENKAEADKIAEQVLINKRSRENAEKTRISLKNKLTGNIDIANRIDKFVDCRSKDPNERELYIVEGDSALSSCKLARIADFQAIISVRGKILNCLKANYDQILKNEIIMNLIKVLGCGIEISAKGKTLEDFNSANLRFSKIIICTDADYDGYQIRTLILAMFYKLMPTLLDQEKIYIAESPLYEITHKNKIQFAYTEKDKIDITSKFTGKYTVQRSKGLGENEADMMKETTMDPETRRLIKITSTDVDSTSVMFETLLGNDLQARKEFIVQKGPAYLELLDLD